MKRRARPLLGTLVEVSAEDDGAIDAAFAMVAEVQARLSRFDPASDIARFNALPCGWGLEVDAHTVAVLQAAARLRDESDGLFDVALGSARTGPGWQLDERLLVKLEADTRLDLGGIGKGYAVDCAIDALGAAGCPRGCVNAGGDLRAFGDLEVPVLLRDEHGGGARPFCALADGALATSCYAPGARSLLAGRAPPRACHVSVAADACLWADALTKVVAASGRTDHPLLARHGALAWRH